LKQKINKEKEAEEKLFGLEKNQDQLIVENHRLKSQLSQDQLIVFEINYMVHFLKKKES